VTAAAIIRVRRPSKALATFEADHVRVHDGLVTASGVWRDDRERKPRRYTWSRAQLVEIRWAEASR
jgi:hypothetical protein